jgi:hypothetical protein
VGALTSALAALLHRLRTPTAGTGAGAVVRPDRLLGEVGRVATRFRGGRQQDAEELLRSLLDGVRVEEQKAVGRTLATAGIRVPPRVLNETTTAVDDVFGGLLLSRVVCHRCLRRSDTVSSFLSLSVPLAAVSGSGGVRPAAPPAASSDASAAATAAVAPVRLTVNGSEVTGAAEAAAGIDAADASLADGNTSDTSTSSVRPCMLISMHMRVCACARCRLCLCLCARVRVCRCVC